MSLSSYGDDFGFFMNLGTRMDLPTNRETILHFFTTLQKSFPYMTEFDCRETGAFFLEESRDLGSFRWVSVDKRQLSSGYVNPPTIEDGNAQLSRVLEIAPFHLDLSHLDCEFLEVVFSYDFDYSGNHDALVAEAFLGNSPWQGLTHLPGAQVLHYEPNMSLVLDESCRLQAVAAVQTRTNAYQIREHQFPELPITLYFTVRQYWSGQPFETFTEGFEQLSRIGVELLESHFIPHFVQPFAQTIQAHG